MLRRGRARGVLLGGFAALRERSGVGGSAEACQTPLAEIAGGSFGQTSSRGSASTISFQFSAGSSSRPRNGRVLLGLWPCPARALCPASTSVRQGGAGSCSSVFVHELHLCCCRPRPGRRSHTGCFAARQGRQLVRPTRVRVPFQRISTEGSAPPTTTARSGCCCCATSKTTGGAASSRPATTWSGSTRRC